MYKTPTSDQLASTVEGVSNLYDDNSQLVEEIKLIKCLLKFPELVIKSMDDLEPQLISNYLMEVASAFHHYYAKYKVITNQKNLSIARLNLINAVRQVLYNGLSILNISKPEKM